MLEHACYHVAMLPFVQHDCNRGVSSILNAYVATKFMKHTGRMALTTVSYQLMYHFIGGNVRGIIYTSFIP